MKPTERVKALNLKIPPVPRPLAAYVPATRVGHLVYTSGQVPVVDGTVRFTGKVGKDLTLEEGCEAARVCALNCLGAIAGEIGDLDLVKRVVRVGVFVNSAQGFHQQPQVANGASELLLQIFGESGAHVRTAVGVFQLPRDSAVEVEMVVEIRDGK